MRIESAEFVVSAVKRGSFPKDALPEAALIGRSNVGKSSLINTLLKAKGLAKTSSTPGKTRTINFYRVNGEFYFVDLPGFGYAEVPKRMLKSWEGMVDGYIEGREGLRGAIVILDARRTFGETEENLYDWLNGFGFPVVTVLTKTDKLKRGEVAEAARAYRKNPRAPHPVLFSAVTGEGRTELLKRIGEVIRPDVAG